MFKKLISNLPFNPSLLGQVSFYAKRLRAEESIRRMGFGFMALTMFIQVFAVVSPPQKSLAYSTDYIAPNGFASKQSVLQAWDNPNSDIQAIYSRFGVTRDSIVNLSQPVTINSGAAYLWTTGRTSLSAVSKAGQINPIYKQGGKEGEYSVVVGSSTIYIRNLKAWDIVNATNNYKAFEGTKPDGSKFWILMTCGNFTQIGQPLLPTPTLTTPTPTTPTPTTPTTPTPLPGPGLELRKSIDGGPRTLKPGDEYTYRFEYRNPVPGSQYATGVILTDNLDMDHFTIVSSTANFSLNGHVASLNLGNVEYTAGWKTAAVLTVKVKASIPNGQIICNAATLTANNASPVTSGGNSLCVNIIIPCVNDASLPATDARCNPVLVCDLTQSAINRTTKESTLTTTATSSYAPLTHVVSYTYDFGDKASKTNNNTTYTDIVKHVYTEGNFTARAQVKYYIGAQTRDVKSAFCTAEVETKPDQPLTPGKSAHNITQKIGEEKLRTTKANPGDIIEYQISIHNTYDYDRSNYTISDDLSDVLEYTDLDTAFFAQQGGSFDSGAKTVSWPNETIKANSYTVKTFRVKVKDPIPATNQPSAMTTSYDCVISNKYGQNEISIPINCPPVKTAEYLTTKLPNTGPGTSVAIGATIMIIIGYFFARSRLLGKELELIRAEYSTGGGF